MITKKDDPDARVAAKYGITRSTKWPDVERAHLAKQPHCVACRAPSRSLQVHHIFPLHYCIAVGRRDLELDERNLITLCESENGEASDDHHLLVGHFGDFESANLDVVRDAQHTFHGLSAKELRANAEWKKRASTRLPHLDAMNSEQLRALRAFVEALEPTDVRADLR
jgi:hypothetical protein